MTADQTPAAQKPLARRQLKLRHLLATGTFALLSLGAHQPAARAQSLNEGEICYAIADNNPPSTGNGGGRNLQDTLSVIDDFQAGAASRVAQISRPGGEPIGDIEALTSRPEAGELIAANGNEIGLVDTETGIFTSLGVLEAYQDFDAIVIDRNSPDQTRLLAVSKARGPNKENAIVQVDIVLGDDGQSASLGIPEELSRIGPEQFFEGTDSIDGIAIDPNNSNLIYGVANGGPRTAQRFVIIGLDGTLQDRGPFLLGETLIEDVEDLSFDLTNNLLFATTGSSRSPLTENAFLFNNPNGGNLAPAISNFNIGAVTSPAIDYEASACISRPDEVAGDLLLVKRITAVTPLGGNEQRFAGFQNQQGTQADVQLRTATNQTFPVGVIQPEQPLSPGDLVEYTVYVYNNTNDPVTNIELCDPLQRPNVLQTDTMEFAPPNGDLELDFDDLDDAAARSPQAPADASCTAALGEGGQFIAAPPGPIGPAGNGGGVVTDLFTLAPGEIAAVRFTVEVGAPQSGESVEDFDL
ncbi:MAG: hypothetical protein AAFN12_04200 [Cyanobacteria bacterium J06560_2]